MPQWLNLCITVISVLHLSRNAWCMGASCATGAGNDYQKDKQFQKLNASKDVFEVKVTRGGEENLVLNTDLVVGDVMIVDTGDKLCAGEGHPLALIILHCWQGVHWQGPLVIESRSLI
jgi:hypothetical protein